MEKDKFTIKDLDLFYGDFQALKKISMHIPEKEITAFIGPSGCGKSTLLKSLNRMNDLVEGCKITGTLLLDGEPINQMKNVNLLRKRVGMVFQKPNPFPMSIRCYFCHRRNLRYRNGIQRTEGYRDFSGCNRNTDRFGWNRSYREQTEPGR